MSSTAKEKRLQGVDHHQGAERVRLVIRGKRYTETGIPTVEEANRLVLRWRELRAAGLVPGSGADDLTLGAWADRLLDRKRTEVSRKTKRKLRPSGIAWWERVTRTWREGPFASVPLSLLDPQAIERAHRVRMADAPKSARDELDAFKAIVREAARRGGRHDAALLTIERPGIEPRKRQALTIAELELLASCAPEYGRRMLLFKGTVGNRIGELFKLRAEHLDLANGRLYVPAENCKEGKEKWIELTGEEVRLAREQLLARPPGSPFLFTTRTGLPFEGRYPTFWRYVWNPATVKAAKLWRAQRNLPAIAPTPFDTLEPHDLRATAATLMRDAGWPRDVTAARLGHADSGELLDRIYDQGDKSARMRRTIEALTPSGLRAQGGAPDAASTQRPAEATPAEC